MFGDNAIILLPGLVNGARETKLFNDGVEKTINSFNNVSIVSHTWDNEYNDVEGLEIFCEGLAKKYNNLSYEILLEKYEDKFDYIATSFMESIRTYWDNPKLKFSIDYRYSYQDYCRRHLAIYYSFHKNFISAINNVSITDDTLIIRSKPNAGFVVDYNKIIQATREHSKGPEVGIRNKKVAQDNVIFSSLELIDPYGDIKLNENFMAGYSLSWKKLFTYPMIQDTDDFLNQIVWPIYKKLTLESFTTNKIGEHKNLAVGSFVWGKILQSNELYLYAGAGGAGAQNRNLKKHKLY